MLLSSGRARAHDFHRLNATRAQVNPGQGYWVGTAQDSAIGL